MVWFSVILGGAKLMYCTLIIFLLGLKSQINDKTFLM